MWLSERKNVTLNVIFSSVLEAALPKHHLRRAVLISRDIHKLPSVVIHEPLYPKDKGGWK